MVVAHVVVLTQYKGEEGRQRDVVKCKCTVVRLSLSSFILMSFIRLFIITPTLPPL